MGGNRAPRAARRRWLVVGAVVAALLALAGVGVALRVAAARETRTLPPSALAPPARF